MDVKERRLAALRRQIERLDGRIATLRAQSSRYSAWRLGVFLVGAATAAIVFVTLGAWQWAAVIALTAVPFFVFVYAHRQVETAVGEYTLWRDIKRRHVARMTLDWETIPAALDLPEGAAEHPFGLDLDLVGERSVHRLMDTAVTIEGSRRLQTWLLNPSPDREETLQRQTAVRELAKRPLFQDKIALHGTATASFEEKWPGQRLLDWLAAQTNLPSLRGALLILAPLSALNIVLFLLNAAGRIPPWWAGTWALYAVISLSQIRKIGDFSEEAFFLRDSLERIGAVFQFLETYPCEEDGRFAALLAPFQRDGMRPSRRLHRVRRVVAAAALQRNPIVWFSLNAVIPWDIYFARRLVQIKRELRDTLPPQVEAWFELEALNSLANYAYLNPQTVWPTIAPEDGGILFEGTAVGHPLISDHERVCNDYALEQMGRVDIVTGSNMAGKSSFLRTLGVNLALAYAGGAVAAERLAIRPFRLFSSMRLTDSVTAGYSFFYAEVRRLQALLEALEEEDKLPLFFMIDEIFKGTNNRERLIGSRAYVRALANKHGVGLIATHDLELTQLAEEMPLVVNYHFRDDVENGRMAFDYKLHPGPCPTTNALKIMELAGLPV